MRQIQVLQEFREGETVFERGLGLKADVLILLVDEVVSNIIKRDQALQPRI